MSLSIGLEALNRRVVKPVISIESAYADFMESYATLQDELHHGTQLITALENLYAVQKSVGKFGFSKSLESLIGHQLGSTTSAIKASVEENKKSVWQSIVDFIQKMIRYVQDFFAKAFGTRRGVMLKLKDIATNANNYEFKDGELKAHSISELNTAKQNIYDSLNKSMNEVAAGGVSEFILPEPGVLDKGTNIKAYANALADYLNEMNSMEKSAKKTLDLSLSIAKRGINKPGEDIEIARGIKAASSQTIKQLSDFVKAIFKSARAFMKGIKKKKK